MSDYTLIEKLRKIYGSARSLLARLSLAYRGETTLESPTQTRKEPQQTPIFFTDDDAKNAEIIDRIVARIPTIESRLTDRADDDIYRRLIEQYRKKLSDLKQKAPRGEKAARGTLDCVKTTILKMIDNSRFGAAVKAHLSETGFELMDFESGRKLDDDELEMLDYRRMTSVKTEDAAKRMTVIEMTQPIITAAYDDDGERRLSALPGVCKVWS